MYFVILIKVIYLYGVCEWIYRYSIYIILFIENFENLLVVGNIVLVVLC